MHFEFWRFCSWVRADYLGEGMFSSTNRLSKLICDYRTRVCMLSMGFKMQDMLSMYEFDESGRRTKHYTMMRPTEQQTQNLVVIDLWNIKKSLDVHSKTLAENADAFSEIRAEEMFVAMQVNSPQVHDILGRMYALVQMLTNPGGSEPLLDDPRFLRYIGEQEYARLKPILDNMRKTSA